MSEETNVKKLVLRPASADGIQFTGKNGAEVVKFVKEYYDKDVQVRNGGSYVDIFPSSGAKLRVLKRDWVVTTVDGGMMAPLLEAHFDRLFRIKK